MNKNDWKPIWHNLLSSAIYAIIIALGSLVWAIFSKNGIQQIHIEYNGAKALILGSFALLSMASFVTLLILIVFSLVMNTRYFMTTGNLVRTLLIVISALLVFSILLILIYG